jgi:hypothetical protein
MSALEQIHYTYTQDDSVMWDSATRDANHFGFAGRILFNDGAIDGFCIELEQEVSNNAAPYSFQTFDERPVDTYERGRLLSSLFQQHYQEVVETDSNSMAAAFQIMVWELTHENFTSYEEARNQIAIDLGAVQFADFSNDALEHFLQMKDDIFVAEYPSGVAVLHNDQYQDFVTLVVPSPPALALAGVALAVRNRRRRR